VRTLPLRRTALVLLLAATMAGCSAAPLASPTLSPSGGTSTSASPSVEPSLSPTTPTVPPTTDGVAPASPNLAYYLARIPKFGPAPKPVPVQLPHAANASPWAYQIPTTQPVAFLTIDDGAVVSQDVIELMKKAHIPVTLFLTTNIISKHHDFFTGLEQYGAVIEDHTVTHTELTKLDYAGQKREICNAADQLAQWYGRRPVLLRPPYGSKDNNTLLAAHDCGMIATFHWRETVNDGVVAYQRPTKKVLPGDIILMHFRKSFANDFTSALIAIQEAGLTPALLEDYVLPPA
jgi:peptidoglycan/xylan/chitin deacetylase (PgdA/CDA1 family)